MVVYITREGQQFVNVKALNVLPADASEIFGVVISKDQDSGVAKPGKVKDVKLNRLLDTFRVNVVAEKEAKIRKFAEECELEAQQRIDASIEESKLIWRKMQSVPVNIAPQTNWAPSASMDVSVRTDLKKSREVEKSAGALPQMKPATASASTKEKGKDEKKVQIKVSETRRNSGGGSSGTGRGSGEKKFAFAKSVPASKSGFLDSIWALDEELEAEPMEDKEAHAFNATVDDDSDDNLNVSDSGLLPGSKKILFGAEEESHDRKSKIVLAQSLPVHVPSFGRRGNGAAAARADDANESEEFQRPDVLALNTYKEEIRSEWLAKSKLNDNKNEDDLEFLQALEQAKSEAKRK
jgi:hypothetical protein